MYCPFENSPKPCQNRALFRRFRLNFLLCVSLIAPRHRTDMLVVRAAPHGLRLAISRRQAFPPSTLGRRLFRVASGHQQGEFSNDAAAHPPAAAEPPDHERAVAPRSMHGFTSLSPSWGRMSQVGCSDCLQACHVV